MSRGPFCYRVCSAHPHVRISSPCGMFDGLCGECENACSQAALEWEYSEENTTRVHCTLISSAPWCAAPRYNSVACVPTPEDLIPF